MSTNRVVVPSMRIGVFVRFPVSGGAAMICRFGTLVDGAVGSGSRQVLNKAAAARECNKGGRYEEDGLE